LIRPEFHPAIRQEIQSDLTAALDAEMRQHVVSESDLPTRGDG
jgi:hypothetical protein